MAKPDIAQQWLKANDPKASAPTRAQMRKGNKQHLVAMARAGIAPVFYHALDEKAHNLLLRNEAKTRKDFFRWGKLASIATWQSAEAGKADPTRNHPKGCGSE